MMGDQLEQTETQILEMALVSPKAAFMLLVLEIDLQLRKLLASTGTLKRYLAHASPTPPLALAILGSVSGATIPVELKSRIEEFWKLRNLIAHHTTQDPPPVVFDYGLGLLKVLKSIPRPSYIVRKANVDLFSDEQCRIRRNDVKGVLLETFGPDGQSQTLRVHPSRREYREGMSLTWEWNDDPEVGWGASYYKDPHSGECKLAWSESMEFAGRDINGI